MFEIVRHIEGYCRYVMVRMRLLDELKLEMTAFCTYLTAHSVVIDMVCTEHRSSVSRTEGLELLENTEELRSDLREVQHGVYIDHRGLHFRNYLTRYVFFNPYAEFFQILFLESKSGGIEMSTEILQKVGTAFYRIIQIKAMYAPCRTCDQTALRHCKYYRRLIICLYKTRSHDSHHSLMPLGIIDYGSFAG